MSNCYSHGNDQAVDVCVLNVVLEMIAFCLDKCEYVSERWARQDQDDIRLCRHRSHSGGMNGSFSTTEFLFDSSSSIFTASYLRLEN